MSNMKKLSLSFLSLTLALVLAGCGGGVPLTDPTPVVPAPVTPTPVTPTPVTPVPTPVPTTATLTVTVTGVASAPVKVTDGSGTVKFEGMVSGSKVLPGLARDKYTVTAGAVTDFTAPAGVVADLSAGDAGTSLTYSKLPGQGLSSSQIVGTLSGWLLGAADVYFERGSQPTVKGQVEASGAVRLPVPSAISADALGSFLGGCTFNGVADNLNVQAGAYSDFRTYAQSGDLLGVVQEQLVSNTHDVWHIYSLEDATFDGTLHCADVSTTLKLDLKKGWNYAEYAAAPSGQTSGAALTTLAADARTQLAFISAKPGVYVALDNPSLDLKAGAQLTRKATVYQTGNYSGTVQLATTVDGLTVEPKTLTLAPLGTLGVKPISSVHLDRLAIQQDLARQSVATTLTFSAAANAQIHTLMNTDALLVKDTLGNTVGSAPLKVNLTAPSVVASASDAGLSRGQSTAVNVSLIAQGQYSGPVQVSVEGLPAGITASTGQATFTGTNTYEIQNVTLNVNTAADAVIGPIKVMLSVNAGGRISRTPLTLTVQQPVVQVNFVGNSDSMHQGESKLIGVNVSSVNGFSGTTTLSLSGLPAGISAAPLTVSVTPGTSTNANFNLVSITDTTLGTATLKITDTDQSNSQSTSPSFQLSVRPQLVALIGSGSQIASAHDGVWVLGAATYNQSTYTYQQTLTRYTKAGSAVLVKTASGSYPGGTLLSTPGGDAVIVGNGASTRYQDDGSVKSTASTSQNNYNPYSNSRPVADNQGRLWSIGFSPNGSGSTLFRTDLMTGTSTTVLTTPSTGNFGLFRDPAGNALYVSGLTNGILTKIDFSTLARTDLTLPGISQLQTLDVAQSNTLWASGGNLFRLNVDGTTTGFNTYATKLAFDPAAATTLWIIGSNYSSGLTKFDTASGTGTALVNGNVQDITPNTSGGIWLETNEGNSNYGLSLVK